MPYLAPVSPQSIGRRRMDIEKFAKDLCAALGGRGVIYKPENDHFAKVQLGDNVLELFCPVYESKISVRISAAEIPQTEIRNLYAGQTSEAKVNPDARTIQQIASDIRRRVIDASAEVLAAQRAAYAKNQGKRGDLAAKTKILEDKGLHVVPDQTRLKLRVTTRGEPYLDVTVSAEGVRFERMLSEIPMEKFLKILAIIQE